MRQAIEKKQVTIRDRWRQYANVWHQSLATRRNRLRCNAETAGLVVFPNACALRRAAPARLELSSLTKSSNGSIHNSVPFCATRGGKGTSYASLLMEPMRCCCPAECV